MSIDRCMEPGSHYLHDHPTQSRLILVAYATSSAMVKGEISLDVTEHLNAEAQRTRRAQRVEDRLASLLDLG
jgi:hypothetical protein